MFSLSLTRTLCWPTFLPAVSVQHTCTLRLLSPPQPQSETLKLSVRRAHITEVASIFTQDIITPTYFRIKLQNKEILKWCLNTVRFNTQLDKPKLHCPPTRISWYQPLQLRVIVLPLGKYSGCIYLHFPQVENGGNYPHNPSKMRQKVSQLFVYFRQSSFSYLHLDNYVWYHFRNIQFKILPSKNPTNKQENKYYRRRKPVCVAVGVCWHTPWLGWVWGDFAAVLRAGYGPVIPEPSSGSVTWKKGSELFFQAADKGSPAIPYQESVLSFANGLPFKNIIRVVLRFSNNIPHIPYLLPPNLKCYFKYKLYHWNNSNQEERNKTKNKIPSLLHDQSQMPSSYSFITFLFLTLLRANC